MSYEEKVRFAWGGFGMLALTVALVIFVIGIVSDHSIRGYYLSSSQTGMATCVYGDAPWIADSIAFCTNDVNDAVEKVKQLNESLK